MPKDVADVLAKLAFKEQQAEAADRSKQKNEEKRQRDRDRNRLSLQNKKTEEADRTQYKPLVPYSPAPTPTAFGAENTNDYTSWSLDHLQSERDRINGTIAQNEVQIARTIDPVARQKLIDDTDALRGTVDSLEKQIHVRRPASVVSEEAAAASEKKKRGVWDAIMGTLNSYTQAELAAASSLTGEKEKAEGYKNTAESEMERSIAGSAAYREGRAEEKALNAELLDAREGNHLTTNERYEKTTRYRELSQSVVARMFNADELSDEEKKQLEADTAELKQLQSELGSDYLNGIERVGAGLQGALYGIEKGLASDVAWLGEKAPQMAGNILFQGGGPMADVAGILLQAGAPYLRKFAGIMSEKQQDIQKLAEKNATSGEKTTYSAVQSGTEMAFDTAMAALTGVGGLTFMGLRVFGGSSQDALDAGASEARAIAYGATHAGIEVLSEKMFDVMGIYGGGYGDDLAKNVIARTTRNPALAKLMVIAFAGIEEPIEEVAAGIADPAAEFWINGEKLTAENLLSKYDAKWAGEIGEAMLVANILGTLGGTVEVTRNGIQSRNGNALEIGSEEWRQEIMSPEVRKSLEDAGIDIGEVEEAIAEAQQALVDRVVEIETQQTHGPRGHSASTHTEEGRTPAQQALHDMDISDGATSANVAEILSSPELKAEFEQIAGVKIEGTPEQQAQIIQDNAQKVGEYVGYKYAESTTETTAAEAVEESEPAKALAPTIEEQREEQRQLRQKETPTETPVADALAPTVNNEAEAVNEESIPEALVPEEQTEQPAEEAPAEETPTEEATEETEEKPEKPKRKPTKERVAEVLEKGHDITDAEIDALLESDANVKALEDLGLDTDNLGKSAKARRNSVRAFAEDIANNGVPTEETVAKIKQDRDIESPEQLAKYTMEQLEEKLEAAKFEKDTAVRKAVQEEINRRKESEAKKSTTKKIKDLVGDLKNRLTKGTEKRYIPADAVNAVGEAITSITESQEAGLDEKSRKELAKINKAIANTTDETEIENLMERRDKILARNEKNKVKFSRVKDAVDRIVNSKVYENDPSAKGLQLYVDDIAKAVGDTPISQMTSEQLEGVYNALTVIDKYCKDAVKTRITGEAQTAYIVATRAREETSGARTVTEKASLPGKGNIHDIAESAYNGLKESFGVANLSHLPPRVMFEFLGGLHKGSTWEQIYSGLNSAQRAEKVSWIEGRNHFNDVLFNEKGDMDWKRLKELSKTVTVDGIVDVNGKRIKMTKGMMLSLWMTMQQEAGRRSVVLGGLKIPEIVAYRRGTNDRGFGTTARRSVGSSAEINALRQQYNALATDYESNPSEELAKQLEDLEKEIMRKTDGTKDSADAILASIESQMTDYDRAWCDAARKFFDWEAKLMQQTTKDTYGYVHDMEDNYFPIARDTNFLNVDLPGIINELNLQGWGNMKARTRFASQPLLLYDIYEVCDRYNGKAAKYAHIMPAVRNFMKVWNCTDAVDKSSGEDAVKQVQSVRNTVESKFGESGVKLIENLLADMQGTRGVSNNSDPSGALKFINKVRSNAASSTLTFNFGVAAAQSASIPTAYARIPGKAIAKALRTHESRSRSEIEATINENSPYYIDRQGNNNPIREDAYLTKRAVRGINKLGNIFNMIQGRDLGAVRTLWRACEFAAEDAGYEKGTAEFSQYATQMWESALEDTQPMSTPLQRPDALRNPEGLMKVMNMYKTVPRQNFGLLVEGFAYLDQARVDLQQAKRSGDAEAVKEAQQNVKDSGRQAARQFVATFMGNATYVACRTLVDGLMHNWDKFRDKDTGEVTGEAVVKRLAWMLGETTAGMFPGGQLAFGAAEFAITGEYYFGLSMTGIDKIGDALNDVASLGKAILSDGEDGKREERIAKYTKSLVEEFSEIFTGLPVKNAEKLVSSVTDWVGEIRNVVANDEVLGNYYDFSKKQNQNQAVEALLGGDDKAFDRVMGRMARDKDESYAKSAVKEAIRGVYDAGDADYSATRDMLVRTGFTEKEADDAILEWNGKNVYGDSRSDWEKTREDREDTDLDLDLDRARGMEGFADLNADSQKEVLDDVYNYYKHLENKEYAEANGIEYENTKYEKYEDLDDPVARMVLEQTLNPAIKKDKKDPSEIANPDVVDALVGKYIAGDMSDEDKAWFEEHDYGKDLIAGAQLDKPIDADTYFDILDFVQDLSKDTSKMKNEGVDERDYKAIDETIKALAPILDSDEAIDIFRDSYTWTDELIDAAAIGMGSETFYKYFDQYNKMKEDENLAPKEVYDDMYRIVEDADDLTREQKEFLHDRLGVYQQLRMGDTTFEKFVDKGMPTDYAEKYLSIWADEKAKLNANNKPGEKEKDLSDTDKLRVIWRDDSIEDDHVKFDYIFATHYAPKQHTLALWLNTSLVQGKISRKDVDDYWNKFSLEYDWHRSWDYAKNHG